MLKRVAAGALLLAVSLVAVGGGWPSPFPLPADHDNDHNVALAQGVEGTTLEVRVAARRLADGRTEFAFQQRDDDGSWGARQLPRRRFFPADTDVGRWLSSSRITVDPPAGAAEASALVRVAAQVLPDGRMELALQELNSDGSWADRRLPTRRFFPSDARVNQWLSSSPLTVDVVGIAFSPSGDDVPRLATATIAFPAPPSSTDGATLVSIEPAIEGSFVWSDDRTLLFQPAFPGWQRGQRYVLRVDGTAAGLARDYTHAFTVGGGLEVAYVIPGDGDREVPVEAQILVQFNRSVAALTVLQEGDAPPVLEFDPPLPGKGEWLNTSLYRFIPADLRPSTTYRVRVPAGLSSAADGALGSDFTWSFETIQPAVVSFEPADNTKWVEPDGPFVVTFNQPMHRAPTEPGIALRRAGEYAVATTASWNETDTVLTLTPAEPLELAATYEIVVAAGLPGAGGGATASERVARFTVVELPRLLSTSPEDGEIDAGPWSISLQYNNPIDADSFEGRISISGIEPDDIEVWAHDSEVSVGAPLEYSTSYTVRIAAGVLDRGGRPLPSHEFSFTTREPYAWLGFATPAQFTTLSATGPQVAYYSSALYDEVEFKLYRLTETEAETLYRRGSLRYRSERFSPSTDPIRTWTEEIEESLRGQRRLFSTALGDGEPLPKGDYYLYAYAERALSEFSTSGHPAELVFSVVDSAVVTKLAHNQLLVWALDHDSGEPIDGVEVRIGQAAVEHSGDYQTATTGADGLARFDVATGGENPWDSYGDFLVRVTDDGRYGVAATWWEHGVSLWEVGIPRSEYRPGEHGYVYTDRPIYRPGETVSIKGIVRAEDDAAYSLPDSSAQYTLWLRDPRYDESVVDNGLRPGELGSFTAELVLPPEAATGWYRVELHHGSRQITSVSFSVAEFRVPEFEAEVATGAPDYIVGAVIAGEASAQFYFGGAVPDAAVEWAMYALPTAIRVEGYEDYSFRDYDAYRIEEDRSVWEAEGETRTDASGVARFEAPVTLDADAGTQEVTISATVTDASGQAVAGSTTATVHPAMWYAGIKTEAYCGVAEEPLGVHLVSVDYLGNIAPDRAVTVRIYEREWVRTTERSGPYRHRYQPVDTEIQMRTLTTDNAGEASFDFAPPTSGTYRLVAESTDDAGRVARSSRFIWVSGRDFAPWPARDSDVIELVADREEYEVGDVARVLVPAPFAGATALVTVERGRVLSSEVRTFETNSELLTIPIEDSHIPNVFVGVVLYRGPTEDDPYPRYVVGYVELPVSTAPRVLEVRVEPDREQAVAGESVAYDVTVTDAEGRGVVADVSVAIVDEAVLALAGEVTRDGVDAFWYQRHLGVRTASSLAVSVDRHNEAFRVSEEGEGDGDDTQAVLRESAELADSGMEGAALASAPPIPGPAPRVRTNFQRTALWIGQLTTGEDGTASFDLHLPDNTTTWRASAQAITTDTLAGSGSSELLVTQPLVVRPALPRFLRVGDDVTLRTLVHNGAQQARVVTATIEAEGVTLDDDSARSATVQPGASAVFEWPARAVAEGTATVRFTATTTGGSADAVEISIPVHLDVTPETTATGGVVEDTPAIEAVYLPDYVITGQGSLELSIQGSLVGALDEELRHFEPYKYESTVRIASRVVAAVAVQRATVGGLDAQSSEQLRKDVRDLIDHQTYVSGWSWGQGWGWCRNCSPDPVVTGWVLLALGEARYVGHDVPDHVIEGATTAIVGYSDRQTDAQRPADPNEHAFLLYALVDASNNGREVSEEARRQAATILAIAQTQRAQLTNWGRAYVLLGLLATGHEANHSAVRAMLNDLTADTIASANGNHWEDERIPGSMHNGSVRITAIVLRALTEVDPQHPLIEETTRWLALGRAADRWKTSVERAQGMASLGAYAQLTGETRGAYDYSVLVNTDQVLAGHFDVAAGDYLDATSVALADLPLGEVSRVQFEREAGEPGRMYYGLNLRYVTPAAGIEALNRGFAVSHRYSLLSDPDTPVTTAAAGDVVRVTVTVVAPADRLFVRVEDFLPAGLEPIDPQLNIVSPWLREQLRADQAEARRAGDSGYCAPWYRWCYSPWDQVDLRDDRLVLQASELPRGIHEYVYYARATTPGDFFVAPVHAEETYLPEVFGRSDSSRFTVVGGE